MRRILALLTVSVVDGVLLQQKQLHGFGTVVHMGTPAQRVEMGIDFRSSELSLFAGAEVRSPFTGELAHSSSLRSGPRGLVDNVTLDDVEFDVVPVSFVMKPEPLLVLNSVDAGILGLSPQSRFALERILAIAEAEVELPTGKLEDALQLELLTELPPREPLDLPDETLPVFEGGAGWLVNGSITVNGFTIDRGALIEFDPTVTFIELPPIAMKRLAIVLRMVAREVEVDSLGNLFGPCDANGTLTFTQAVRVVVGESQLPVTALSVSNAPRSETGLCMAPYKVNSGGLTWRVNPLSVLNTKKVFLDAAERTVTFRRSSGDVPIPHVPALKLRRVPLYDAHSMIPSVEGGMQIVFPPAEAGYFLSRLYPGRLPSGALFYAFTALTSLSRKSTIQLPGRFRQVGGSSLMRIGPGSEVILPFRRDPIGAYTITIEHMGYNIGVFVTPYGSKTGTGEAAILRAFCDIISAEMRNLGSR